MVIKNPTHKFYPVSNTKDVTTFKWENVRDRITGRVTKLVTVSYLLSAPHADGSVDAVVASHRNNDWIGGKIK